MKNCSFHKYICVMTFDLTVGAELIKKKTFSKKYFYWMFSVKAFSGLTFRSNHFKNMFFWFLFLSFCLDELCAPKLCQGCRVTRTSGTVVRLPARLLACLLPPASSRETVRWKAVVSPFFFPSLLCRFFLLPSFFVDVWISCCVKQSERHRRAKGSGVLENEWKIVPKKSHCENTKEWRQRRRGGGEES